MHREREGGATWQDTADSKVYAHVFSKQCLRALGSYQMVSKKAQKFLVLDTGQNLK